LHQPGNFPDTKAIFLVRTVSLQNAEPYRNSSEIHVFGTHLNSIFSASNGLEPHISAKPPASRDEPIMPLCDQIHRVSKQQQ